MTKRVLDVGQCDPDHGSITRFLTSHFDVEIDRSHVLEDTIESLRNSSYDLVLINRKLDRTYTDGTEILQAIKADDDLKEIPVMIVSNYDDAQQAAVAAGAVYGFGKLEYEKPEAIERVAAILK